MYLSQIEIDGFKGIKHLSLDLNKEANVLIGENQWGRSSLISALMLLSLDNLFYQFIDSDFFYDDDYQSDVAKICYIFTESSENELNLEQYLPLESVKYRIPNVLENVIAYQIVAEKKEHKIVTEHYFLDIYGNKIFIDNQQELIELLISLNPIMRLKNPINGDELPITNQPLLDYYIEQLSNKLTECSKQFSANDLKRALIAARSLLEYYLVDKKRRYYYKNSAKRENPTIEDWYSLDRINNILDDLNNDYVRAILMGLFSALLIAKGGNKLLPNAVPILILEEPESQLHPIILSVSFRLLNHFPTQKIITTNSSDLISLFSLENIYHFIRKHSTIVAMHIGKNGLSASDSRRILFHILYRRSSAIFARCWFLVEGETEIWLLREMADQSGYHLGSEGIQLIEFAQCGLKPLIKYATKMGIHWYVLTDGDQAGKKYADTVRSLCPEGKEASNYLTVLPARDIETFLFKNGFSHVYKMVAYGSNQHVDLPISRIIQKAVHRSSKPDLAIAVCDDAKQRGGDAIPGLLRHTFNKVTKLAKEPH